MRQSESLVYHIHRRTVEPSIPTAILEQKHNFMANKRIWNPTNYLTACTCLEDNAIRRPIISVTIIGCNKD